MRFSAETIASFPPENGDLAREVNRALDVISASRVSEVRAVDYITSKTSWKLAALRQAITYRALDLGEAAIREHAAGSSLSAIVLARAVMETVALFHRLTKRLQKAVLDGDVDAADRLAMTTAFGAKGKAIVAGPEYVVQSIMAAIDDLEKDLPGVRELYEFLSEMAHPNGMGHQHFYAKSDKANLTIRLATDNRHIEDVGEFVASALFGLLWFGDQIGEFDRLVGQLTAADEASTPPSNSPSKDG